MLGSRVSQSQGQVTTTLACHHLNPSLDIRSPLCSEFKHRFPPTWASRQLMPQSRISPLSHQQVLPLTFSTPFFQPFRRETCLRPARLNLVYPAIASLRSGRSISFSCADVPPDHASPSPFSLFKTFSAFIVQRLWHCPLAARKEPFFSPHLLQKVYALRTYLWLSRPPRSALHKNVPPTAVVYL